MTLAFLGDGVYELFVREMLVKNGSMPAGKLHAKAVELVKASAQAKAYDALFDKLNENEQAVIRGAEMQIQQSALKMQILPITERLRA